MIWSLGEFAVALVACNFHVCDCSEFDEDCSADCWYVRFRSTLLVGHGGPSLGSSPTPLLNACPVNWLLSSLLTNFARGVKDGSTAQSSVKCAWIFKCVESFCFCPSDPLLCLCSWHRIWPELHHSKHLSGFNATKWTAGLRALLKELGVPNALDFHGHDIRRGAAIDIFSERGVAAMLQHCNWRSLRSANPCVPSDEIQAGLIAQGFADESEPDS